MDANFIVKAPCFSIWLCLTYKNMNLLRSTIETTSFSADLTYLSHVECWIILTNRQIAIFAKFTSYNIWNII